jgi:hypothetical protein
MNNEDVLQLAGEAGLRVSFYARIYPGITGQLTHFAELVADREREACARLCAEIEQDHNRTANDNWEFYLPSGHEVDRSRGAGECAQAIRHRNRLSTARETSPSPSGIATPAAPAAPARDEVAAEAG